MGSHTRAARRSSSESLSLQGGEQMKPGMLLSLVGSVTVMALAVAYAQTVTPVPWKSRAIPEAQGEVKEANGKKMQVRYKEFSGVQQNWSQWRTYAYSDSRPEPPTQKVAMPKDVKGDAALGRKLFLDRAKAPCMGCHLIQGDDVWP